MVDDMRSRVATAADYPIFARLFPELGTDDKLPTPEYWASTLAPQSLFIEDQGVVVGYGFAEVMPPLGYIRHVIVAPSARGRGIGRRVMEAFAERFRGAGCDRWCLNVMTTNAVALRLYERVGMQVQYATRVVRFRWDDLRRLPVAPPGVAGREIRAEEEAALEREFNLSSGLLASKRPQPNTYLLRLADPSGAVRLGLAWWNPSFPGAYPFCAVSAAHARVLLETMRPYATPGDPELQLVIENDAPLADALIDAGASAKYEILHMEGAL